MAQITADRIPQNFEWGTLMPQIFRNHRSPLFLGGGAAGPASNTMWHGPRPTSISSGILIHPAGWPQYSIHNTTHNNDRLTIIFPANCYCSDNNNTQQRPFYGPLSGTTRGWTGLTVIVYTAGCHTGCTTRFDNRLNEQWLFVQHGCQTGFTTGCMFVYTIQPVVQPLWQPVVSCGGIIISIKTIDSTLVFNVTNVKWFQ